MNYSRWATIEELKEKLTQINMKGKIEKSGIPMYADNDSLYVKDDEAHSMIIGSLGSGKTQTTVLPQLRLAIKAEESFIVSDSQGEIFWLLNDELKKENYNTIVINLKDVENSYSFNPLSLPYSLYRAGKKDQAIDILENVGNYIFGDDSNNTNADPFWKNSAISLFVGLVLYQFENNVDNVTICDVAELLNDFTKIEDYYKTTHDKNILMYLRSIVLAPKETKGSIISVFSQSIKLFTTRESLSKLMLNTNFDLEKIQEEKTALFIIPDNKGYSRRLVPMIIDECYQVVSITGKSIRRLNILIDEFEALTEIKDLVSVLTLSRSLNIKFSIYIRSFLELENTYGKETCELLKITFSNIIYLLSNDINTLEEISKMCGNERVDGKIIPLITPEELRLLDKFEAVILIPRINPIRTRLIPDYKINW